MADPDETRRQPVDVGAAEHLRLALEAGELGTWRWTGDAMEWDERLERLFGLRPGEFDGTVSSWLQRVHPDDRDQLTATIDESVEQGAAYTVRHRIIWPDGSVHWLEGRGQPIVGPEGGVIGSIGCARDITDNVLAEDAQQAQMSRIAEMAATERLNSERLEFLLHINDALASPADARQVMQRVTSAAVPRLGDWCAVHVMPRNGAGTPDLAVAHTDPEMLDTAAQMANRLEFDPDAPAGLAAVIRTGRSELYPSLRLDELPHVSDVGRDLIQAIGVHSMMIVPLRRNRRVYGAMSFFTSRSSRAYTDDDLVLAEAVAGRIAAALENLRLTEQQGEIARVLQSSLLPDELPDIPHFDVAVRYTPSGEGAEVGGDFYDAFPVTGRAWGIAIGDVCGKGPEAAAVTALARHTIRTSAWRGDTPETVLARLNEAIQRAGTSTFCTTLYGVLVPERRRFISACGGHPLPILVHADGRAETVGRPGMLLGAFPVPRSSSDDLELPEGSTLVLYTDGVTDLPPPHELRPEGFAEIVSRCAREAADAEELADLIDETLDALRPASARIDDIALMILRHVP